jgi:predicted nucleotidyltransferase
MEDLADLLAVALPAGVRPVLFGSLACDAEWPVYSDVDLALIFEEPPEGIMRDLLRVGRRAAPLMLRIDPLQHHGPYILTALDRRLYFSSILPTSVLERATTLDGRPLEMALHVAEDRLYGIDSLIKIWIALERMERRESRLTDRYTAKFLVSLALLAPALTAAACGAPVEKGASFDWLRPRLSEAGRAALEGLEAYRREWDGAIRPLPGMLRMAGGRAPALARQINRWPDARLARRVLVLIMRLRALFADMLRLIAADGEPLPPAGPL